MYLSNISPPVIIHAEITSLTKKGRNNKQKHFKKKLNVMYIGMMIDHDVPAKRYGNKVLRCIKDWVRSKSTKISDSLYTNISVME